MQAASQFERRLTFQLLSILRSQKIRCCTRWSRSPCLVQNTLYRANFPRYLHISSVKLKDDDDGEKKEESGDKIRSDLSNQNNSPEKKLKLEDKDDNDENETPRAEVIDRVPTEGTPPPDVITKKPPKLARTLEEKGYLMSEEIFLAAEKARGQTKEAFVLAVEHYKNHSGKYRRGHIEFIDTATKKLRTYKIHRDREMYKLAFSLFPEKAYIPPSKIMEEFYHMPRHQDAAIHILQVMENNDLIPDEEIGDMIAERFSKNSQVMYKYQRMLYWMTKFANINPWPIPYHLPDDGIELAKMALIRMAHDITTTISAWKSEDVRELQEEPEDTFIVSAQSSTQQELLAKHPSDKPLYVEGGHYVFLEAERLTYYVLKTGPPPEGEDYYAMAPDLREEEEYLWEEAEEEEQTAIVPGKSVHEQEDGNVMSMCITGSSSQNSLVTWLRCLEKTNPNLKKITVVFKLSEPDSFFEDMQDEESKKDK